MPGYHGSSHMDSGLSYAGVPQGYRSDDKMASYGKPPNGYISHDGMKKAMDYMSGSYGSNVSVSSSTNAGTSPNVSSMDPTYKAGPAQTPIQKGGNKYA